MTDKSITEKPLVWIRIEAADEARCHSEERLAIVKPDWKLAQKEMNYAGEALLEAQSAARERFTGAYDEETSRSLSRLTKDFEEKAAAYRRIDSKKRHLDDEVKKLREGELKMIADARDPDLFAGGEKLGPNGWQRVRLRDLTGHPDMSKDPEKQVWKSMELEKHGYDTVHQFLQGRGRLIPALLDDGEIASTTLGEIDAVVYRFLEKRSLLNHWPKDIDAPKGEQMILQADKPKEPAKGKNMPKGKPKAPEPDDQGDEAELPAFDDTQTPATGPLALFKPPSAAKLQPISGRDPKEISQRLVKLMYTWEGIGEECDLLFAFTEQEEAAMHDLVGPTPYTAVSYILAGVFKDNGLDPESTGPVGEKFGLAMTAWMTRASELGEEAGLPYDELTIWFMRKVIEQGAEDVRRVGAWSADLGAAIAAFRDSDSFANYEPTAGPFETAAEKSKPPSKPAEQTRQEEAGGQEEGQQEADDDEEEGREHTQAGGPEVTHPGRAGGMVRGETPRRLFGRFSDFPPDCGS